MTLTKVRKTAQKAALEAGAFIRDRVGQIKEIGYKGVFNIVTDVDKGSEKLILDILKSEFPDDGILAEEGGGKEQGNNRRWLIDPLDGTTNFTHSYPFFAVSIALEEAGEIVLGVVFNPLTDELFIAEKGLGAYLNDDRIKVSANETLAESLLATGFPPGKNDHPQPFDNLEAFNKLTVRTHGVRRDGSASLDLCYVACGRLDGFWELELAPWDVGAGSLIVEEAGGRVTNLNDGRLDMASGHIVATNKRIHGELIEFLVTLRESK